jgi:hypothetical protein
VHWEGPGALDARKSGRVSFYLLAKWETTMRKFVANLSKIPLKQLAKVVSVMQKNFHMRVR